MNKLILITLFLSTMILASMFSMDVRLQDTKITCNIGNYKSQLTIAECRQSKIRAEKFRETAE